MLLAISGRDKFQIFRSFKGKMDEMNAFTDLPSALLDKTGKRFFQRMAIRLLFTEEQANILYPKEDEFTKQSLEEFGTHLAKFGLSIDKGNRLIYQTFTEYFAAQWFIALLSQRKLTDELGICFLESVLGSDHFLVVRSFSTQLLTADESRISRQDVAVWNRSVHVAAGEGNATLLHWILSHCQNDEPMTNDQFPSADSNGKTPLFLAAARGHVKVVKEFIQF